MQKRAVMDSWCCYNATAQVSSSFGGARIYGDRQPPAFIAAMIRRVLCIVCASYCNQLSNVAELGTVPSAMLFTAWDVETRGGQFTADVSMLCVDTCTMTEARNEVINTSILGFHCDQEKGLRNLRQVGVKSGSWNAGKPCFRRL